MFLEMKYQIISGTFQVEITLNHFKFRLAVFKDTYLGCIALYI